jgi:hypothetical protein
MGIDLRLPIGLMFTAFGLLLCGYGIATRGDAMYARHSLGININLGWGMALLLFGAVMLTLVRRGRVRSRAAVRATAGSKTDTQLE